MRVVTEDLQALKVNEEVSMTLRQSGMLDQFNISLTSQRTYQYEQEQD